MAVGVVVAVFVGVAVTDGLAVAVEPVGVAAGLLLVLVLELVLVLPLLAVAEDFDAELLAGAFVVGCLVPDAVAVGAGDRVSVLVLAGVVTDPGLFDRV